MYSNNYIKGIKYDNNKVNKTFIFFVYNVYP